MRIVGCFSLLMIYLFCTVNFESLQGMTLHTVLVCDTLDTSIGSSTQADCHQVRLFAQEIAKKTNMKLKETVLQDRQVRPKLLFKALENLKFESDDVVLFYFSGHGYRSVAKGKDVWPFLYFSVVDRGVDFTKLTKELRNKHPRLLLAIADCCNNVIPQDYLPLMATRAFFLAPKITTDLEQQNLTRLFVETQGTFITSSSIPGQYSWGGASGGLFTYSFIHNLKQELLDAEASWEHLFAKTVDAVISQTIGFDSGVQIPQYLYINE